MTLNNSSVPENRFPMPDPENQGRDMPKDDLFSSFLLDELFLLTGKSNRRVCLRDEEFDGRFQLDGIPDSTVNIGGLDYIFFSGSGYLGNQSNPKVLASACEAILLYGISCATTRRHYVPIPVVEVARQGARMFETESAYYAASSHESFILLLESLVGICERIFIDEACHEFFFEAINRLPPSILPPILVRHHDTEHLRKMLEEHLLPGERPLFITEGVFPVFGTITPLPELFSLLAQYDNASILIDDSHGFGVLGKQGLGTLEHFGYQTKNINRTPLDRLEPDFEDNKWKGTSDSDETDELKEPPLHVYWTSSLSKAIGGIGGLVPGSRRFVDRILEKTYRQINDVLTTPGAAATNKALDISFHGLKKRKILWSKTLRLKKALQKIGISVEDNQIPIIPIFLGTNGNMRRIQKELADRQILVTYLPHFQQKKAQGMLRITLSSNHTNVMIDTLVKALKEVL